MESLPTINLKGRPYVQVKDRVSFFNETFTNGKIQTEIITAGDRMVTFKATVTPDCSKPDRFCTGHSFGTIDEVKAFEKLETVSVGRALALLGIGILDSIASADEMERYDAKSSPKPSKNESNATTGGYKQEDQVVKFSDLEILDIAKKKYELQKGVSKKTNRAYTMLICEGKKAFLNEDQYSLLISETPLKGYEEMPF